MNGFNQTWTEAAHEFIKENQDWLLPRHKVSCLSLVKISESLDEEFITAKVNEHGRIVRNLEQYRPVSDEETITDPDDDLLSPRERG